MREAYAASDELSEDRKFLENKVTFLKSRMDLQKNSIILFTGYKLNVIGINDDFKINAYHNLDFAKSLLDFSHYTYLKNSLNFEFVLLRDFILSGAEFKERFETYQTAFLVKVLERFSIEQKNELLSFLTGIVVSDNILNIRKLLTNYENIYLLGNSIICEAYKVILQKQFDISRLIIGSHSSPNFAFDKEMTIYT